MNLKNLFCCFSLVVLAFTPSYAQGLFTNYTKSDGLIDNSVKFIAIDLEGNKWFGGKQAGVSKFDGTSWVNYTTEDSGFVGAPIRSITVDSKGNVWITSTGGISKFDGTGWRAFTTDDGLPDNSTFHVVEDRDGNYWMATNAGVSKFDGTTWTTYTKSDGLGDNRVNYIAIEADSIFWFATQKGGITRFDGTTWTTYDTADGLGANEVRVVVIDQEGNKWIGTRGGGASKFDGTSWTTYKSSDGLAHNNVWGIAVDGMNNIWFATYGGGVSKFDGSTWTTYTSADGLASDKTNTIVVGSSGKVYIGTEAGVSVMSAEDAGTLPAAICDYNGNGILTISDAVALLLLQRDNPGHLQADYNRDDALNLDDVYQLILDWRSGNCPESSLLLASASVELGIARIEGLSREDIAYVEEKMAALDLTAEEQAALNLALYGPSGPASLPKSFSLAQNVPNPFNPTTTISYSVPEGKAVNVLLKVFDTRGILVRTLVAGLREPGVYNVFWDGTDNNGRSLASGVYFYRLQAGDYAPTRKMVLLK